MQITKMTFAALLLLAVHGSCLASKETEDGVEDARTAVQRLYAPRPIEEYPLCLQKLDVSAQERHQIFLDSAMGTRYKKQFAPYFASTEGIKDDPELVNLANTKPMFLTKEEYPFYIQDLKASDERKHIVYLSSKRRFFRWKPRPLEEIYDDLQLCLQRHQETQAPNLPTQN